MRNRRVAGLVLLGAVVLLSAQPGPRVRVRHLLWGAGPPGVEPPVAVGVEGHCGDVTVTAVCVSRVVGAAMPRAVAADCAAAAASLALSEDAGAAQGQLRYYTADPGLLMFRRQTLYLPGGWAAWVPPCVVLAQSNATDVGAACHGEECLQEVRHEDAKSPPYVVLAQSNATDVAAVLRKLPVHVNRLMVVCHPDDELIFGGRELAEGPGAYVVVAVTSDGVRELGGLCHVWGLGACVHLRHADAFMATWDARIVADLAAVLAARRWELVATHAAGGEYGHPQHRSLHVIVTVLLRQLAAVTGRAVVMGVFKHGGPGVLRDNAGTALTARRFRDVHALYGVNVSLYQFAPSYQALQMSRLGEGEAEGEGDGDGEEKGEGDDGRLGMANKTAARRRGKGKRAAAKWRAGRARLVIPAKLLCVDGGA